MLAAAQMLTGARAVNRGCDGDPAGAETAVGMLACAGALTPAQFAQGHVVFLRATHVGMSYHH